MARPLGYGEHEFLRATKIRLVRHNFRFDSIDAQRIAQRFRAGRQLTLGHHDCQSSRRNGKIRRSPGLVESPVDGLENSQKIVGICLGIEHRRLIADANRFIREGQQDLDQDRLLVGAELSGSRHCRSVYNGGLISTGIKL